MKKIILIIGIIAFTLFISLICLFCHAHTLHHKFDLLKSEYTQFIKLQESLQKGTPKNNSDLLKASKDLIEQLGLKKNVEHLKPIDHCIEISLKNLTQASLINFLKSLDALPSFRILKSNFETNSSGELALTLLLVSLSTQTELIS